MNDLAIKNDMITSDLSIMNSRDSKKFTTLNLKERSESVKLYNALQQCDVLINDIKGETIEITDAYIESKQIPERDDKTEEIKYDENGVMIEKTKFRTILFSKDGKTYVSSAYGVYNSMITILALFGNPSKENTLRLKVGTRKTRNNRDSLILSVVE